jgi:isochorismate synthase
LKTILNKAIENFNEQRPFVLYRKPDSNQLMGLFQRDDSLYTISDYTESGFAFAPFNSAHLGVLIPYDKADQMNAAFVYPDLNEPLTPFASDYSKEKNVHIRLIQKGVDQIKKGSFKKAVLARKEQVLLTDFNFEAVFVQMACRYRTAFVYTWFHPAIGLWMGASPETLIKVQESSFETMSLAGTQLADSSKKEVQWGSKEIDEQQLVTDFIADQLQAVCSEVSLGKAHTTQAGNLLHLRTKIKGEVLKNLPVVQTLVEKLHPTPAVCGLPRDEARAFILKNEGMDRKYYSGFLGILNSEAKTSELFVNLRCMEIEGQSAFLYIGGGITQKSDTEKEWEETVSKSLVMKKVLK